MYTGKYARKRSGLKPLVLVISAIVLMMSIIGGTVAWLVTQTAPLKNTFTYGDINIKLEESDTGDNDGDPNTNTYNMIPGYTIHKDPEVTVAAGSEDSWLFVKLEKSESFDDYLEFEIADGWIQLEVDGAPVEGVYYRAVYKENVDQSCYVIKDNTVTVKSTVTKEMLSELTDFPTLTITAYAVQRDANIASAADAWALIASEQTP